MAPSSAVASVTRALHSRRRRRRRRRASSILDEVAVMATTLHPSIKTTTMMTTSSGDSRGLFNLQRLYRRHLVIFYYNWQAIMPHNP